MELVGVLVTGVVTLVAVWIGSRLSRRGSERDWVREKRGAAYLELLDLLIEINTTFAVGLRVSNLKVDSAIEHGHDFEGVEDLWRSHIDDLEHIELRVNMLGGNLTKVYRDKANDLIVDMMDALDNDEITEDEWDLIVRRGRELIDDLVEIGRDDLGIITDKLNRKLKLTR
jgi:hypothetical protein